ncbi:hypothetical protein ABG067_002635 [Albugo candida]
MYASRSDRELVLNIIDSDFGQIAKVIAQGIIRSDGLQLPGIIEYVQRTVKPAETNMSEIKCGLLKLLQHNLLIFKPVASLPKKRKVERTTETTSNACYYVRYESQLSSFVDNCSHHSKQIDISEVLYRIHFPRFINQAKKKFGDAVRKAEFFRNTNAS